VVGGGCSGVGSSKRGRERRARRSSRSSGVHLDCCCLRKLGAGTSHCADDERQLQGGEGEVVALLLGDESLGGFKEASVVGMVMMVVVVVVVVMVVMLITLMITKTQQLPISTTFRQKLKDTTFLTLEPSI
jgi:hypothetical protein